MHIQTETKNLYLPGKSTGPNVAMLQAPFYPKSCGKKRKSCKKNLRTWLDLPSDSPQPLRGLAIKVASLARLTELR